MYKLGKDMHNVSYHIWIRKKKKNLRNLVDLLDSRQNMFFIQKLKFPELALEPVFKDCRISFKPVAVREVSRLADL